MTFKNILFLISAIILYPQGSCLYLIREKIFLPPCVDISSLPAYRSFFIVPWTGWEQICDRLKRLFERVGACRLRFITRADEIYFFGKQMNTKTNFRRPSMVRWFGLVFQFSARRRRRDVIVKYNYSVSRRLFLTPGSSPSFSPVLAIVRELTIDRLVSSRTEAIQSHDFKATISRNPASWLKYPVWAVFPRDFH